MPRDGETLGEVVMVGNNCAKGYYEQPEATAEAIDAARTDNKNSVLMRVKSGGSSRFVAVPLAKG